MKHTLSCLAPLLLVAATALLGAGCGAGSKVKSASEPFFEEHRLVAAGDYGSAAWRIPALVCLPDGTLLATLDRRKFGDGDLPQDIDIVLMRSADRGRTWSAPQVIAAGRGVKQGFGDAALAVSPTGRVVCAYVGGNGIWGSSAADPIRSFVTYSDDQGRSWSTPVDLTARLWGPKADRAECADYQGSFFASGNGLCLAHGPHAGRLLFAAAMRRPDGGFDNYVVYSDDDGLTWRLSSVAFRGGDEAKLTELTDGTVLISVRRQGERGCNRSHDGGATWGEQGLWGDLRCNACNGDLLWLMRRDRGDSVDLLAHSLPNSLQREDVSLFLSADEGRTWPSAVRLCDGPSAYSSLALLDDGSIGVLVEKLVDGRYEIWFQRCSPAWVLRQASR